MNLSTIAKDHRLISKRIDKEYNLKVKQCKSFEEVEQELGKLKIAPNFISRISAKIGSPYKSFMCLFHDYAMILKK